MKRLFILLVTAVALGWAMPQSAHAAPAHVTGQSCGTHYTVNFPANISCIFPHAIGAGHFLWVCLNNTNQAAAPITWSGDSGTFTAVSGYVDYDGGGGANFTTCVYVPSAGGGGTTITATSGNLLQPNIVADEFTDTGLLDVIGTPRHQISQNPVTNSITPSVNSELILTMVTFQGTPNPNTITVGAPFTLGGYIGAASSTSSPIAQAYYVQPTAALISASWSNDTGNTSNSFIVSFKPAAFLPHTGGQLISAPLLPQLTPSVVFPPDTGYTHTAVASGANLQTALTGAACGTKLLLAAGGSFSTGSAYTMPNTACTCHVNGVYDLSKYVIIQSDDPSYTNGSVRGTRIDPSTEYTKLAHIVSTDTNAAFVATDNGTSCYWFGPGLDINENAGNYEWLIEWGDGSSTNFAHDIVIDHSYLHGKATTPLIHCIQFNGNWEALVDSYVSDCHGVGQDTQAVLKYDGWGPTLLQNNFLEGAAENTMWGGASPQAGILPSDATVQRNYFFKPLSWYLGSPTFYGIHPSEKNIFEWKLGQRILATGNVWVNSWSDAQIGVPLLFNPGCSSAPPNVGSIWDVTYYYNILQNAPAVYNYGGCSDQVTQEPHRFLMHDNLYYQIDPMQTSSGGTYKDLLVNGGGYGAPAPPFNTYDIWHVHETFSSANIGVGYYSSGQIDYGMQFRDSILDTGSGGAFFANGGATGDAFVSTWQPGMNATYNCYYGSGGGVGSGSAFTGKQTVADQTAIFTTPGSDFHVKASSACYHAASDGKSMGADIDAVNAATAGVVQTLGNLHTVTNVSPSTFTHLGGTGITITGTNFISGEAQVIIGGAGPAVAETSNSCGFGSPGQFTVTVSTDTTHFTYTGGCVVVTSAPITLAVNDTINVTVNSAQTTGTVNRYTPGNLCTSLSVVNSTTITCTTPAATGTVTNGSVSVFECQFGICAQFNGANYN